MNKSLAKTISRLLRQFASNSSPDFRLTRTTTAKPLVGFHKWADGKPLISADRILRDNDDAMRLLLIDWHEDDEFYCVLYPDDRSSPIAELWSIEETAAGDQLVWNYRPVKRDGKNEQRKNYFSQIAGDLTLRVALPTTVEDVPPLLCNLFALHDYRLAADQLAPEPPEAHVCFPEGGLVERMHRARERNSALVAHAKRKALAETGKLECQVCKFDFFERYGEVGKGYIEAHHIVPLSELSGTTQTKVEDLALVCSNCHRMIHRKRPWLSPAMLETILCPNTT